MASVNSKLLNELISVKVVHKSIALVTILGDAKDKSSRNILAWGTNRGEHRINPDMVEAFNQALDLVENNHQIASLVVTAEGHFFCNGMDLKWIDTQLRIDSKLVDNLQRDTERLLARIMGFGTPTIAAINGHFCAAGAMLGLAFDFRVMVEDRGLFFVPGVDLGLIYSPGMTELLKSKLPVHMWNHVIVFSQRYYPSELLQERVVEFTCPKNQLISRTIDFAINLCQNGRFKGVKYRETMKGIKMSVYKEAHKLLTDDNAFLKMGFESGEWDERGRSKL